jgi:hypothetical protein
VSYKDHHERLTRSNIFYDYYEPYSPSRDYHERWLINSAWREFEKSHPFNAQLLSHLFGENAPTALQDYKIVSETKAAALCSYFNRPIKRSSRLA